jgi:hypothetical protein
MRYKVANPIQVEFSTKRISPYLRRTTYEIAAAWEQLHGIGTKFTAGEVEIAQNDDEDGIVDPSVSVITVETPTVRHLMIPAEPTKAPDYWKTRPAHEVCGYPPDLIPDSNPDRLIGAERRANAGLILQRLEYRAGPLWPVVLDAVVFGKTMSDIGRRFGGGNSVDAAKVGRPLVVAGLRLCARALDEIARGQTPDEARRYVPMRLPTKSIAVENAIMRRIARAPGRPLGPENTNVLR